MKTERFNVVKLNDKWAVVDSKKPGYSVLNDTEESAIFVCAKLNALARDIASTIA